MECWHMSGAGNDFMVIDARGLTLDFSRLAVSLCKLTRADGFMAVDYSAEADFRLHFYNSDGSRGEMCGNGSRCICRFAYDRDIAGADMTVETDSGILQGIRLTESQYAVMMNLPSVLEWERVPGVAYVELGVPHAIVELPALNWDDRETLLPRAKELRHHPAFPKGANVNFFSLLSPDRVRVLTFERGVENYTLACGTGCGSITSLLFSQGRLPGGRLTTENQGGTLQFQAHGSPAHITALRMEGPTQVLSVYDIDPLAQ